MPSGLPSAGKEGKTGSVPGTCLAGWSTLPRHHRPAASAERLHSHVQPSTAVSGHELFRSRHTDRDRSPLSWVLAGPFNIQSSEMGPVVPQQHNQHKPDKESLPGPNAIIVQQVAQPLPLTHRLVSSPRANEEAREDQALAVFAGQFPHSAALGAQ